MTGFGAVLAFEVADAPTADRLCDAVHVIVHATSLGGIESTIERRGKLPGQEHVPPGLLRLSAGCEHIDDLWNDLSTALGQATRPGQPGIETTGGEPAGCQMILRVMGPQLLLAVPESVVYGHRARTHGRELVQQEACEPGAGGVGVRDSSFPTMNLSSRRVRWLSATPVCLP